MSRHRMVPLTVPLPPNKTFATQYGTVKAKVWLQKEQERLEKAGARAKIVEQKQGLVLFVEYTPSRW